MTIFFCPLCQDYSLFFYTNYEVEQHHFEHHQVEQHLVAHCQVEQHQVEQQQVEQQQVEQQQVVQQQDQKVVFFCPVCQDAKLLFSSNYEVNEHKKGCFPHECKDCNLIAFKSGNNLLNHKTNCTGGATGREEKMGKQNWQKNEDLVNFEEEYVKTIEAFVKRTTDMGVMIEASIMEEFFERNEDLQQAHLREKVVDGTHDLIKEGHEEAEEVAGGMEGIIKETPVEGVEDLDEVEAPPVTWEALGARPKTRRGMGADYC